MGNFTVSPHEMAPYPGIIFETSGNYGSTTFDSFGSAMLSIVICDACMKEKADRVVKFHSMKSFKEYGHKKWDPNEREGE